jgi:hypothetical protein
MRSYAGVAVVMGLLYVPLYAALFNSCVGSDLGHSTPLIIPRALLGLPFLPFYPWDEEKLNHHDPEIDLREVGLDAFLVANGAFWGYVAAGMVALARRVFGARKGLVIMGLLFIGGCLLCFLLHLDFEAEKHWTPPKQMVELEDFYELYRSCYRKTGEAPNGLEDLEDGKDEHPLGYAAAASGQYVIIWGTAPAKIAENKITLLAYRQDIEANGGWILGADGSMQGLSKQGVDPGLLHRLGAPGK